MRSLAVITICALAVGAAFADQFIVGVRATQALYPFRGC
jgi:hypothetical protein